MLPIVKAPSPILSQEAKSITRIDATIHNLISEMKVTLAHTKDPEGVGLAAPQVGKSVRLFLAKPRPNSKDKVFINPKIISSGTKTLKNNKDKALDKLEGCLSLPQIWGEVQRMSQVKLAYLDENGKAHTQTFSGFLATIIQHEVDHLHGILFPKRVLQQNGQLYRSHKDEKGKDVFEEIEL